MSDIYSSIKNLYNFGKIFAACGYTIKVECGKQKFVSTKFDRINIIIQILLSIVNIYFVIKLEFLNIAAVSSSFEFGVKLCLLLDTFFVSISFYDAINPKKIIEIYKKIDDIDRKMKELYIGPDFSKVKKETNKYIIIFVINALFYLIPDLILFSDILPTIFLTLHCEILLNYKSIEFIIILYAIKLMLININNSFDYDVYERYHLRYSTNGYLKLFMDLHGELIDLCRTLNYYCKFVILRYFLTLFAIGISVTYEVIQIKTGIINYLWTIDAINWSSVGFIPLVFMVAACEATKKEVRYNKT